MISQQGIACRSIITVVQVSVLTTFCVHYRINDNFVIEVVDFGLSEDIYARNYFRQWKPGEEGEEGEVSVKLPVRWMAVDSLNDGVFTEKSDVVNLMDILDIELAYSSSL